MQLFYENIFVHLCGFRDIYFIFPLRFQCATFQAVKVPFNDFQAFKVAFVN